MTDLLKVSSELHRMQRYGPAPTTARVKTPEVPTPAPAIRDSVSIHSAYVMVDEVKVPKAEEIRQMIKENGYPFKSDIYRAVTKLLEHDLN